MYSKSKLQDLIAEGKIRQVLLILLDTTKALPDNDLHNEVIIQLSAFEEMEKGIRTGISQTETQNILISRIRFSLLQIIDKLEKDSNDKNSFAKVEKGKKRSFAIMLNKAPTVAAKKAVTCRSKIIH